MWWVGWWRERSTSVKTRREAQKRPTSKHNRRRTLILEYLESDWKSFEDETKKTSKFEMCSWHQSRPISTGLSYLIPRSIKRPALTGHRRGTKPPTRSQLIWKSELINFRERVELQSELLEFIQVHCWIQRTPMTRSEAKLTRFGFKLFF